jgi:GT2 family glycosyltransferase
MKPPNRQPIDAHEPAFGSDGQRAPGAHAELPTVDVVICAYTIAREALLRRAIGSVAAQGQADRIIVVIDHGPDLLDALSSGPGLGDAVELHENIHEQGLSGARNTGLGLATADIVAFLDDDARADSGWLASIRQAHGVPGIVGTGGRVSPEWDGGSKPRWFPEEFLWTVGCSYLGLPTARMAEIRNPIGANMSFERARLVAVGGFRTGLGRIGTTPLGCEETEAAIRLRASGPGGRIVLLDDARVDHFVPESRATWSYFRDRCLAEGRSKAIVTSAVGGADGLSSERRYVLHTLPSGVLRGVGDAAHGDISGLQRSGAIVSGLSLTALGYVSARVSALRGTSGEAASAAQDGRLRRVPGVLGASVRRRMSGRVSWPVIGRRKSNLK